MLKHFLSSEQIGKNFEGSTFKTWAIDKINEIMLLRPFEYVFIGFSVLKSLFGICQVGLYLRFRYCDKNGKNKDKDKSESIELSNLQRNLLGDNTEVSKNPRVNNRRLK